MSSEQYGGDTAWPPNPYCLGCAYYRSLHSGRTTASARGRVCHYLLDTGHARGCPFGEGCNKRSAKRGKTLYKQGDQAKNHSK